nr:MAG TPA: Minor capsid protein [Caudoviricetes sp.]
MAGVKFDIDKIKEELARRCTKAEHIVAIQIEKDTSPYTPALTGSLNQRTRVVGNSVVYPGPYARYLYYGKLMVDPDTGSPWAQPGTVKVLTDRDLVFTQSVHPQAQAHWFEASKAQNLDKWLRVTAETLSKK